jgi:hypothetical protein
MASVNATRILAIRLHKVVDEVLGQKPIEIKRPVEGGRCAAVWNELDKMSNPTLDSIRKFGATKGWNEHTVATQYYRWKQATGYAPKQ